MPDTLVNALTIILLVAVGLVVWTAIQSWLNYRAVHQDSDLRPFARNVLFRQMTLLVAVASLAFVGVLSLLSPRPGWARIVSNFLLVILVLALVGMAWHEYLGMRKQMSESDDGL